jgi:hypothetical protein
MIQKTNIIAIALEHQLNVFQNKDNEFICHCPLCISGYIELNEHQGYFYCYNCGSGGDLLQFDEMVRRSKQCF